MFFFAASSMVTLDEWHDWEEEVHKDPHLYKIFQEILSRTIVHPNYEVKRVVCVGDLTSTRDIFNSI